MAYIQGLLIQEIPPDQAPMDLLLEADPCQEKIQGYLLAGRCFVGRIGAVTVGVYVVVNTGKHTWELMNMAVAVTHQGGGLGTLLLAHTLSQVQDWGAKRLEVGTGTFGFQLRFYQKAGFRAYAVERDFFLNHYPQALWEQGIRHLDMLRLAIDFQ